MNKLEENSRFSSEGGKGESFHKKQLLDASSLPEEGKEQGCESG